MLAAPFIPFKLKIGMFPAPGGGGPIIGGQKATVQGSALDLVNEFASEEVRHLEYLRAALGPAALPCPEIDIGYSFNNFVNLTLASLENFNPYAPFSPYKDFISLYLGAFILADPEVFAYLGAATLISNKTILSDAAGITAVEGYHAGAIRENLATVSFVYHFLCQLIQSVLIKASPTCIDNSLSYPDIAIVKSSITRSILQLM